MEIKFWLNGKMIKDEIEPNMLEVRAVILLKEDVKLQTVVYVQFG